MILDYCDDNPAGLCTETTNPTDLDSKRTLGSQATLPCQAGYKSGDNYYVRAECKLSNKISGEWECLEACSGTASFYYSPRLIIIISISGKKFGNLLAWFLPEPKKCRATWRVGQGQAWRTSGKPPESQRKIHNFSTTNLWKRAKFNKNFLALTQFLPKFRP